MRCSLHASSLTLPPIHSTKPVATIVISVITLVVVIYFGLLARSSVLRQDNAQRRAWLAEVRDKILSSHAHQFNDDLTVNREEYAIVYAAFCRVADEVEKGQYKKTLVEPDSLFDLVYREEVKIRREFMADRSLCEKWVNDKWVTTICDLEDSKIQFRRDFGYDVLAEDLIHPFVPGRFQGAPGGCNDCQFGAFEKGEDVGRCCLNPPQLFYLGSDRSYSFVQRIPMVHKDYWCGKYMTQI